MKYTFSIYFLLSTAIGFAQSTVSLDQAIAKAITLNYDIQIETLNWNAAQIENSRSGAGMLPRVNLGVGDTYSTNNILQRFANGQEITSPNAAGNQFNTFIQADWLVFDGMRMFYRKDRLQLLEEQSKINVQVRIQELVRNITTQYANLLRIQQLIQYTENIIEINTEKEAIAKLRWEAGTSSKTEYLQAAVALSEQQVNLLNRKMEYRTQQAEINKLMGEKLDVEWTPIPIEAEAIESDYEKLLDQLQRSNLQIQSANLNASIFELQEKEARSARLPQINLSAAYNFTRVDNTAGFSLFNRSFGPQAGIALVVPLFNAGDINRTIKTSEIQMKQSEVLKMQMRENLTIELSRLLNDLKHVQDIIRIESEIKDKSEEWVNIELERLKNGQSNITEVFIAQSTLENSVQRLADARYKLEITITELRLLTNA